MLDKLSISPILGFEYFLIFNSMAKPDLPEQREIGEAIDDGSTLNPVRPIRDSVAPDAKADGLRVPMLADKLRKIIGAGSTDRAES